MNSLSSTMRRLASYFGVGLTTIFVYYIVLITMRQVSSFSLFWNGAAAFGVATVTNYLGHRYITFSFSLSHLVSGPRFCATLLFGFCYTQLVLLLGVSWLEFDYRAIAFANAISWPLLSYFFLRCWVFADVGAKRGLDSP